MSHQYHMLDDAVPRHRKRAVKKRYSFKLEYIGKIKSDWLGKMLSKPKVVRYETRAAAEDALESWKRGRGIYGFICKPDEWKGSIT